MSKRKKFCMAGWASQELQVTKMGVRHMAEAGKLKVIRTVDGHWLFDSRQVRALAAERQSQLPKRKAKREVVEDEVAYPTEKPRRHRAVVD